MSQTLALIRAVPPSIGRCELTHVARQPIDLGLAQRQHSEYQTALRQAGCMIEAISPAPELPDSVFVEDAAVAVDEVAVITRPGAASRRPETVAVAAALGRYRRLVTIAEPGTLDGGDVLVADRRVYVGVGGRTNPSGFEQIERCLAQSGYEIRPVETRGCLHLKSAVTTVSPSAVLVNPAWVDPGLFAPSDVIEIDPSEPFAANVLLVGTRLLVSVAYPRTAERLAARGLDVFPVDVSELAKAEGALTCCSVILRIPPASTTNTR